MNKKHKDGPSMGKTTIKFDWFYLHLLGFKEIEIHGFIQSWAKNVVRFDGNNEIGFSFSPLRFS